MTPGNLALEIILLVLFFLLHGLFAAWETAGAAINDKKLDLLAKSGDTRGRRLKKLTEKSQKFLATMRIGQSLSGLCAAAVATLGFGGRLYEALMTLPLAGKTLAKAAALLVILVLLCYFMLVFTSLIPKKIAAAKGDGFVLATSRLIAFFMALFTPLYALASGSGRVLLRLFGVNPDASREKVTEEEILMMVDAGEEEGAIHEEERAMIENVFEFNDTFVEEIMTHRTDMACLGSDATLEDVIALATSEGYSRIPIYEQDIDHIVGILFVKDILPFASEQDKGEFDLARLLHPVYFVPESKKANSLFRELQRDKNHLAIVVDEYGGTAGLITMEDLIESIMGDIVDEYDQEEPDIRKLDEHTYLLDGGADIDDVAQLFGKDLSSEDYDTVGGLIIAELGRIPADGETPVVKIGNLTLAVLKVEERRIVRVRATLTPPPAADTAAPDDGQ